MCSSPRSPICPLEGTRLIRTSLVNSLSLTRPSRIHTQLSSSHSNIPSTSYPPPRHIHLPVLPHHCSLFFRDKLSESGPSFQADMERFVAEHSSEYHFNFTAEEGQ